VDGVGRSRTVELGPEL